MLVKVSIQFKYAVQWNDEVNKEGNLDITGTRGLDGWSTHLTMTDDGDINL